MMRAASSSTRPKSKAYTFSFESGTQSACRGTNTQGGTRFRELPLDLELRAGDHFLASDFLPAVAVACMVVCGMCGEIWSNKEWV